MKKKPLIITTLSLLSLSFANAQSVPGKINYQGRVTDAAGVGLGTGAPITRKIIFRVFDAPTAGNRLWSEEQMVTISEGEFSVLLGGGTKAIYSGVEESPRKALSEAFISSGVDRYLEIVVDNGDGTLNVSDPAISPRQAITSTAYAFRAQSANSIAGSTDLTISPSSEAVDNGAVPGNYGLGWYGEERKFGGLAVDGPVLFGKTGGALGVVNGATKNVALNWTDTLNVGIGTTTPRAKLDISGSMVVDSGQTAVPTKSVLGGNGSRIVISPGSASGYPYGFGIESNNLWSTSPSGFKWYAGSNPTASMALSSDGKLGIGTASPVSTLSVNGTASVSGDFAVNGNSAFTGRILVNSGNVLKPAIGDDGGIGTRIVLWGGNPSAPPFALGIESGAMWNCVPSNAQFKWYGGTNACMVLTGDGRLGVGTDTPDAGAKLTVGGDAVIQGGAVVSGRIVTNELFATGSSFLFGTVTAPTINSGMVIVGGDPAAPKGRLDVGTNLGSYISAFRFGFSSGQFSQQLGIYNVGDSGFTYPSAIFANGDIVTTGGFVAASDERTKNIKGVSDSVSDLKTLMNIEITDFTYRDLIAKGSKVSKKVIAQQVESVFPQAVSRRKDSVPDIYKAAKIKEGWVELETDLRVGEKVRLIMDEKTEKVVEVAEVDKKGKKFRVELTTKGAIVFVYGRQVDDFRTVDYDAVSMLNVSATQQIKKEKDVEVKTLQEQNAVLLAKIEVQAKLLAELEAKDKAREARLTSIEKALADGAHPQGARTVSTQTATETK